MSKHNRDRKLARRMAKASKPSEPQEKRPDPGPPPTYQDDNPNPFTGERDGRRKDNLYTTAEDGTFVTRFGDSAPGAGWVKRKAADGSGTGAPDQDQQATPGTGR